MQVLESLDHASGVKSGNRVFERAFVAKCSPEIAAEVSISKNVDEFLV